MSPKTSDPLCQPIGVIGAGAAGLITAHTLIQDGFTDVQIITQDCTPGGVWSEERVYPGLRINNVHGEYRFSSLKMESPSSLMSDAGRLTGDEMRNYMETFAKKFLTGRICFNVKVLKIKRDDIRGHWNLEVINMKSLQPSTVCFSKLVLCTGGAHTHRIPYYLSFDAAKKAGFKGLIVHPITFRKDLEKILLKAGPPLTDMANGDSTASVVIVGCGKAAQDHAAYLANKGCNVTVVFERTDAFVAAGKRPLPDFIRRSRFLSVLSPHIELRTGLERLIHKTWLGGKIASFIWNTISRNAFKSFGISEASPLRQAIAPFWAIRSNDEGVIHSNSFHALARDSKIKLISPARVIGFGDDGSGLSLSNGALVPADVVIVATGYSSSWTDLFDAGTAEELGLHKLPLDNDSDSCEWRYSTLADPPSNHHASSKHFLPIYRGIVPARIIDHHDFAINGAIITPNNGYAFEVCAHWISSYFLHDKMYLPSSQEALARAKRNARWLQARYPHFNASDNPSLSSDIAFWNWPQAMDELLEDLGLRTRRSGGNWLTWPFQVIDTDEISHLREERGARRKFTG